MIPAMATITTDDGVRLHVEDVGTGTPIVFVHEWAGDVRSYEPQLRHFSRRYRCIAYNARGYPPSDVPDDVDRYSQDRARDDILAVLDGLGIDRAHVVGTSMGAFATLHFGLTYPDRARSLVLTGCGYGAEPASRKLFLAETLRTAEAIETAGMAEAAARLCRRAPLVSSPRPRTRAAGRSSRRGSRSTRRADRPTPCAASRRVDPRSGS